MASMVVESIDDAAELLARYVELHNEAAVAEVGEDRTAELFAGEPHTEVEGLSLSALRRLAIVEAFKENELMLWEIAAPSPTEAHAHYAWRRNPRLGGVLSIESEAGRIRRLVVKPGYARVFAALSMRPPPLALDDDGPNVFADDG